MHVHHIYHSGFSVELADATLLFDWYQGDLSYLPRDRALYVLVSHDHCDHYSRDIWTLGERFADVRYIVDREVAVDAPAGCKVLAVEPHGSYHTGAVEVQTLESNDKGVAFVVRAEGRTIFFSGDLNVWWWDRDRRLNEWSEAFFRQEVARVAGPVEVAFVPVDPRLKGEATRGLAAFAQVCGASTYVPMHYWGEAAQAKALIAADPALDPIRGRIRIEDDFDL